MILQQQDRAIAALDKGIQDLPRLTRILHNERVCVVSMWSFVFDPDGFAY